MIIKTWIGLPILVDDADYPALQNYSWYVNKTPGGRLYAQAREPKTGKRVFMHRLLTQAPRGLVVHHKNNNGLDNRRENLEITTHRKNILYANESKPCAHKQGSKWRAQVRGPDGKIVSLGMFETKMEAVAASTKFKQETRI